MEPPRTTQSSLCCRKSHLKETPLYMTCNFILQGMIPPVSDYELYPHNLVIKCQRCLPFVMRHMHAHLIKPPTHLYPIPLLNTDDVSRAETHIPLEFVQTQHGSNETTPILEMHQGPIRQLLFILQPTSALAEESGAISFFSNQLWNTVPSTRHHEPKPRIWYKLHDT